MRMKLLDRATALVRMLAVLFAAIVVSGCASTRMAQVDPADAAQVLEKGDKIEITRLDGAFVPLKVVEITGNEIIGDDARVPIDDIAAITKLVKVDSNGGASSGSACGPGSTCDNIGEVWRWVGFLLLLGIF